MRTLSSLKEKSVNADYNVLLGTTFPDTPQKITGTVSAVFSTASNAFVILMDKQFKNWRSGYCIRLSAETGFFRFHEK